MMAFVLFLALALALCLHELQMTAMCTRWRFPCPFLVLFVIHTEGLWWIRVGKKYPNRGLLFILGR